MTITCRKDPPRESQEVRFKKFKDISPLSSLFATLFCINLTFSIVLLAFARNLLLAKLGGFFIFLNFTILFQLFHI